MIVTCQNCSTRLQLDEAKVPARAFSVRCPKCQQIVNSQPPAPRAQRDALSAVTNLPTSTRAQEAAVSAKPAAGLRADHAAANVHAADGGDVLRQLATLLRRHEGDARVPTDAGRGAAWGQRRVLVCLGPALCEEVVAGLTGDQYVVFVAGGAAQAAERMREGRVDVIVLDEEFDRAGSGAAAVARAVNSMRMADRRRIVLVLLSRVARTGDAHAAFLGNVNLVVNAADIGALPPLVERNVRDLNDLYQDFNKALNVTAL